MGPSPTSDTDDHLLVLSDFLSNVPPALTLALVQLAPLISTCKSAFQISSWSTSWYYSWLALASWWAICLLLDRTFRTFLPFVILVFVALAQRRQQKQALQSPTTEYALRTVITDLTIIQTLLPSLPQLHIATPHLFRAVAILYVPYLALSYYVPFRVICGIMGTIILSWRAPWAIVLRTTIWRSAWLRWSVYKAWAGLTGNPLPPPIMSFQPLVTSVNPVQSLRFLFTVYENQRWWMALDWTAALLPGERPSWCSASQHPLSPPGAFALPENTTVYLPDGSGGKVKRTATWRWEEPEWRVIVRKDGSGLSRVERPLPSLKEESPSSSRLLKAAGKLRDSSISSVNSSLTFDSTKNNPGSSEIEHPADGSKENPEDELLTDADGWVYGDNKWEGQSNRGGLGKYTRYRRWTRIAIVFEEVERLSFEDPDIHPDIQQDAEPRAMVQEIILPETASQGAGSSALSPPDSPLRQRLRNALQKGTQPTS